MSMTRAGLNNFYADRKPYLEEIIGMDFKENPALFSQFLNTKSTSGGWIDFATVSGFGLFKTKAELVDAATDDVVQGPVARAAVVTYAKQNLVSQESIEDDEGDKIIASRLPGILRAGRATQEILGHDLLNAAFSTVTTPDGVVLCSDSHVNLVGTTCNNVSAADLSQADLQAAITKLENQADDRNIPIYQKASKLITPPDEKFAAQVILGSAQVTASANNDINPLYGAGIMSISSPYISDIDSWFLLGDQHGLNFHWRVTPENWSEVDYVKSGVRIGARFRCAVSATDWRGIVGSPGAS